MDGLTISRIFYASNTNLEMYGHLSIYMDTLSINVDLIDTWVQSLSHFKSGIEHL